MDLLPHKDRIENYKNVAEIAQVIATVVAIVIGGIWTYKVFVAQRQKYPRLKVEHRISHRRLPDRKVLLTVEELLSNTGTVLLPLQVGEIRVSQVLPLSPQLSKLMEGKDPLRVDQKDVVWPLLHWRKRNWENGEMVVEPGETEQLYNDFLIGAEVETVQVLTYLKNPSVKRELGWGITSLYDLRRTNPDAPSEKRSRNKPAGRRRARSTF